MVGPDSPMPIHIEFLLEELSMEAFLQA